MAVRTARSAVHHREQARCRWQYWDRDGGAGTRGRLYAPLCPDRERHQSGAFRQAQLQFPPRHCPGGGHHRVPNVVSVTPSLPVETIPQLIAHAKANPGKLNFGAPTAGTLLLAAELFKMMAGVNIVHVAYRGGGGLTDLLAGRLQVSFDVMPSVIEYVRAGKLRGLAVTTAARSPALPDLPPVGDFVPGYEASSWHGIGAPKNTPADIVEKLNNEINAVLTDPKVIGRLAELGGVPMPMTPVQFGQFVADETEKWGKVIKSAGIKPE